ncbi:hypothetical protein VE02_10369 [Pseudogymnoascus sp. 03VT05]|nr:hypothetical protein VE02_10369 [Pseudogymnoascus sp. 03VT05]
MKSRYRNHSHDPLPSVCSVYAAFGPKLVGSSPTTASSLRLALSAGTTLRSTQRASREEFAALCAAEEATPLVAADVAAAATKANRSVPKFRSEAERDLYEEARATQAALESGLAQIRSSLRHLQTEQESVPALLGELVAAVGNLPTAATPVAVLTRGGRQKEGDEEEEDGGVGAAYRA